MALFATLLAGALGAGISIASALNGTSSEQQTIGGPPSFPLGPPDEGKRRTPDILIGQGRTYRGRVELVAYGWLAPRDSLSPGEGRNQFCVWIEHIPDEVSPGACDRALSPEQGAVAIDDAILALGLPALRHTEIGGRLAPEVASIEVLFRHRGSAKRRRASAVVAQVSGGLQEKLRQPAPFGYYLARVRGLVPLRSVRVRAFDLEGRLIGSAAGLTPHVIGY